MTRPTATWTPFGAGVPPRSAGGITLAEWVEAYCAARSLGGEEIVEALVRDDGTGPIIAAHETARALGELVIGGTVRTWARPIGGGTIEPLPPSFWEIDDFGHRVRTSALNLERWADPSADATHWIFVDAAEAEAVVAQVRREWDEPASGEPEAPPQPTAAEPKNEPPATAARREPAAATAPIESVAVVSEGMAGAAPARARRLLKLKDVTAATRLSKSRIYEKIRGGSFPKGVKMGVRATAWYEDEVDAWIDALRNTDAA